MMTPATNLSPGGAGRFIEQPRNIKWRAAWRPSSVSNSYFVIDWSMIGSSTTSTGTFFGTAILVSFITEALL